MDPMSHYKMRTLLLLIIGIWTGMIIGISFMEAPLKFQAPDMTIEIALGVGQLVFGALNKAEIIFSVVSVVIVFLLRNKLNLISTIFIVFLSGIISLQSLWLLPILDTRVTQIINGMTPEASSKHIHYVICEIIKVILLISTFIKIYPNEGHKK